MTSSLSGPGEREAEIRARLDAVVPAGPWEVFDHGGTTNIVGEGGDPYVAHIGNSSWPGTEEMAAFIANSPEDIKYLLRRLDRYKSGYEHAKDARDEYSRKVIGWREAAERATARGEVLEGQLAKARELIADLADEGKCWFDHNGHCQEHGWFETEPACPHGRAKALGLGEGATDER